MAGSNGPESIVDFYTDVVLPALAERLDSAFPEFGWRRDARGWVASNEEMTHRALSAPARHAWLRTVRRRVAFSSTGRSRCSRRRI